MSLHLSESEIIARASLLPAFPGIVNEILRTLDDDNATIGALIHLVERDPVIAANILAMANAVAMAGRTQRDVNDIQVAVSLIGLAKVREIVLGVSLASFARDGRLGNYFWEHSVAVGVATQELARLARCSVDYALVCGLLHDIGQLFMARCYPLEFQMVRMSMERDETLDLLDAERQHFGMDHCAIGAILAHAWRLSPSVVAAVQHHHDTEPPADKLVAVTHVGEALANALDLARHDEARVLNLSASACDLLGMDWSEDLNYLFGKIEARARQLCRIFS